MEPQEDNRERAALQPGLNSKAVAIAVTIFALIVAGMFGYAYLKSSERQQVTPQPSEDERKKQPDDRYAHIDRIDGKHFYEDGVHTIVGELAMPTPCDLLNAEATVAESFPEQVTLDFEVINNAETCAQVITPARFQVRAEASEEATFSARFNGRPVELNLRPAAPGETPEDFELYIKG